MSLKLGELLVQGKLLTEKQLELALESQRIYGGKLGTNLVELGLVKDTDLARFLAVQLKMEAALPQEFENISKAALDVAPREFVERHKIIPLRLDQRLRMAICDPHDLEALDALQFKIGKKVQAVIAPEIWIVAALERYYQVRREIRFVSLKGQEGDGILEVIHDVATEADKVKPSDSVAAKASVVAFEEAPLADLSTKLVRATSKEEVFDTLLDYLGPLFPRIAVYVFRKNCIAGWILRGFPVHAREFARISISLGSQSILRSVMETNSLYRGTIAPQSGDTEGFGLLKIEPGTEAEIHPIPIRGQALAVLLAIPGENRGLTKPEASKMITLVCEKAGFALEMVSLRQHILRPPAIQS